MIMSSLLNFSHKTPEKEAGMFRLQFQPPLPSKAGLFVLLLRFCNLPERAAWESAPSSPSLELPWPPAARSHEIPEPAS